MLLRHVHLGSYCGWIWDFVMFKCCPMNAFQCLEKLVQRNEKYYYRIVFEHAKNPQHYSKQVQRFKPSIEFDQADDFENRYLIYSKRNYDNSKDEYLNIVAELIINEQK